MGLVAGQARVLMLTSRKLDLEFAVQNLCQQITNMSSASSMFAGQQADLATKMMANPNDPNIKGQQMIVDAKTQQLQAWEKVIANHKTQLDNQHKMIETEMESAKKIVDKAIDSGFKYFA